MGPPRGDGTETEARFGAPTFRRCRFRVRQPPARLTAEQKSRGVPLLVNVQRFHRVSRTLRSVGQLPAAASRPSSLQRNPSEMAWTGDTTWPR